MKKPMRSDIRLLRSVVNQQELLIVGFLLPELSHFCKEK
jgi:hypothetical protein